MKEKSLIVSLIINFIIAITKFLSGLIFNLSSLFADGIHTTSDFISNIISIISFKLSKKRKNKKYPFGFGMIEYMFNVLVGLIVLLVGIFILFRSFHINNTIPNLKVLYIMIICLILKFISISYLKKQGKNENNKVLLLQAEEGKMDLYSSIMVAFIIIILQFSDEFEYLKYVDNIGSFIISILILKTSLHILKENILHLLGINELDEEKYVLVKKIINTYKDVTLDDVKFISYGHYYLVDIELIMKPNIPLKKVIRIENGIKRKLMNRISAKYININTKIEN